MAARECSVAAQVRAGYIFLCVQPQIASRNDICTSVPNRHRIGALMADYPELLQFPAAEVAAGGAMKWASFVNARYS